MSSKPPKVEQDEVESQPSITIDLTPEFYRNLRDLEKLYRHIRAEIQTVIQDLEMGNFVGNRISGIGEDVDPDDTPIEEVKANQIMCL
jgi:hypothetical protein